jgi:hypothetical protein
MAAPEISEFSYGFALTSELVRWADLSAAPVFPSLIAEGGPGGGFDVKLDRPGAPLYLQFKRSECMLRKSAREWVRVHELGGILSVPFYRFHITEALKSAQHEMLLALDTAPNLVFYAAPKFHRLSEIDLAWHAVAVSTRSVFIAPSEIGSLDFERHSVAFDAQRTWVCSEPREIYALSSRQLLEKIQSALSHDDRPLGEKLPEVTRSLNDAEVRGRERAEEIRRDAERRLAEAREAARIRPYETLTARLQSVARDFDEYRAFERADFGALEAPEPTPPAIRPSTDVSPERRALGELAERAARTFGAQLVFVQPND